MFKIIQPTLLLNQSICKENIRKMAGRADRHRVQLIPHFKTHQSAAVGEWFKEEGITAITVTSVKMAEYFADHGWKDITIAFPVNVLEIDRIKMLAARVDLKIFINSRETASILKEQLDTAIKFYIEIDVGDERSGVEVSNIAEITGILEKAGHSQRNFIGFYTHPGHTYNASSRREVGEIFESFQKKLRSLKSHFRKEFPNLKIALGDTPSCSIVENFDCIDSIHPGNFVYYDLVQQGIGVNSIEEIAICLAVPVVAVHPERQEVIVHSGWTHQGKDSLPDAEGNSYYGLVVQLDNDGWSTPFSESRVIKLSQEHGIIKLPPVLMEKVKVGDVLGILPVHACATALMMGEIWTLEGERLGMMRR